MEQIGTQTSLGNPPPSNERKKGGSRVRERVKQQGGRFFLRSTCSPFEAESGSSESVALYRHVEARRDADVGVHAIALTLMNTCIVASYTVLRDS